MAKDSQKVADIVKNKLDHPEDKPVHAGVSIHGWSAKEGRMLDIPLDSTDECLVILPAAKAGMLKNPICRPDGDCVWNPMTGATTCED